MNLQLQPILEENIPELAILAHKIWNVHYPPIVGQEQVDYMLGKMYSPESLLRQMQTGQEFYFIQKGKLHLGFIAISKKHKQEYFIHKFYVDSEVHRKGIGAESFRMLLEMYQPVHTFHLQVNRMNHTAINFYFKQGFHIQEVIDMPIGDGFVMNDFLMIWTS